MGNLKISGLIYFVPGIWMGHIIPSITGFSSFFYAYIFFYSMSEVNNAHLFNFNNAHLVKSFPKLPKK